MKVKLKTNEIWILCLMIIIHSLILYFICDFSKTMETYKDELYYFNLAKCLSDGRNFSRHGIRLDFVHIAYPLVMCPIFLIKDAILRVHLITLLNSVLMSISIIPVWLLCKELEVNKKIRWLSIFIIMIYPSMTMAATVMSENLYWPLTLFTYYYIVRVIKYRKICDTVIAGILSFSCYFCKEVGIVIFLSNMAWFFIAPVDAYFFENRFSEDSKEPFIKFYVKCFKWKHSLVYFFTYVVSYLIVNKFFLSTIINGYGGVSSAVSSLMRELDLLKIIYILYTLVVYLICAIIAFMVIPVVIPMLNIKELNPITRKTYFYTLILFVGTILTIACTISIKEDFGKVIPRVHMRYFSSMVALFLSVYGSVISQEREKFNYKNLWFCLGLFSFFSVFVFKGIISGSAVDAPELGYMEYLYRKFWVVKIEELNIYPVGVLYGIFCWIVIVVGYFINKRKKKYVYYLFYLIAVFSCFLNSWKGFEVIKNGYWISETCINDMESINNYFMNKNLENKNVVFVCGEGYSKSSKVYDTYFNGKQAYLVSDDTLIHTLMNNSTNCISNCTFSEPLDKKVFQLDKIDYFITDIKNFKNILGNIECVDSISSDNYLVFKNINPSEIYYLNPPYIIDFTGKGFSSLSYRTERIWESEEAFSWTEGNKVLISCDFPQEVEHLKAQINIVGTFNGIQNFAVYQNDVLVSEGSISDSGQIIVDLNVVDGVCNFKLDLPNAVSPYERGVSEDKRVLALAISSIEFFENE